MANKQLLITGATGLVGEHFIRRFSREYDIYALAHTLPVDCDRNVQYYECDFSKGSLPDNLPKKIDGIIHLAQSNKFREFPSNAIDIFNVNVRSTALLLDYAKKAESSHFIYASTGGIYGASTEPLSEDFEIKLPKGDLNYYFNTKLASENLVKAYSDFMSVHILRPFFIYGRNQKNNMLIPRLLDNIRKNKPIILQGENGIALNPIHANDVSNVIEKCLSIDESFTINVAGSDILTIRDISELIGLYLGKKPVFKYTDGDAMNIIARIGFMKTIYTQSLIEFQKGVLDIL